MRCTVSGISDSFFKGNEREISVDFSDKCFAQTRFFFALCNLAMAENIDDQSSCIVFEGFAVKRPFSGKGCFNLIKNLFYGNITRKLWRGKNIFVGYICSDIFAQNCNVYLGIRFADNVVQFFVRAEKAVIFDRIKAEIPNFNFCFSGDDSYYFTFKMPMQHIDKILISAKPYFLSGRELSSFVNFLILNIFISINIV